MQRLDMLEIEPKSSILKDTRCRYCGEPLYITDSLNKILCVNSVCKEKIAYTLYCWLNKQVPKEVIQNICDTEEFDSVFSILNTQVYTVDEKYKDIIQEAVNNFKNTVEDIMNLFLAGSEYCKDILECMEQHGIHTIKELYEFLEDKDKLSDFYNSGVSKAIGFLDVYKYLLSSKGFLLNLSIEIVEG